MTELVVGSAKQAVESVNVNSISLHFGSSAELAPSLALTEQQARVLQAAIDAADHAMQRYASGDESAFAELYDALAPRLHAFILRRIRDRSLADDLLQQTFLHIHRARGRFLPDAAVMPWAFAIARRLMIDRSRRRRSEHPICTTDDDRTSPPGLVSHESADELLHSKELAARFESEFSRLAPRLRVAYQLVNADGLSIAEAAQVLGTTPVAVRLRIHRTYEALRAVVAAVDEEHAT